MFSLPAGFLSGDKFDEFVRLSKDALVHMIEHGEVPEFVGSPMKAPEALAYLESWLDRNKITLVEGGADFLAALARRLVVSDEPEQPIEEFEASLALLTDEQLVALNEREADEIEALKVDVIDRRRAMLADILDTGKQLLRGAVATGLHAVMGKVAEATGGGDPQPSPDGGGEPGGE